MSILCSDSAAQRHDRRTQGAFYTPAPVAKRVLKHSLALWREDGDARQPDDLRLFDPACGDGAFLAPAYRWLLEWRQSQSGPPLGRKERIRILLTCVFGVDSDSHAVAATIDRLADAALGVNASQRSASQEDKADLRRRLARNIVHGDALSTRPNFPRTAMPNPKDGSAPAIDWARAFPVVFDRENSGFDVVVGNPPYVKARLRLRNSSVQARRAKQFQSARGAYDLYALFVEQAMSLLRAGGVGGMIVPNKIGSQEYARPLRLMLGQNATLLTIEDLSRLPAFPGVGVYPWILTWRNDPPSPRRQVTISRPMSLDEDIGQPRFWQIPQAVFATGDGWLLDDDLEVESRVPTQPLGKVAKLHSGATGFTARRLADCLEEMDESEDAEEGDRPERFEFIVSGNIDRYRLQLGDVRFMRQRWRRPRLSAAASALTDGKRRLYRSEKIVIAGLTRRLEAAWDSGGLALGVQVYAVTTPVAATLYLLALLNSRLLSYLYAVRHGGKRLDGGYLAVNKGPLAGLPIRMVDCSDASGQAASQHIARLARRLTEMCKTLENEIGNEHQRRLERRMAAIDRQIDGFVYDLYGLKQDEIDQIEAFVPA